MRPAEFVQAIRDAAIDNPGAARVRVMTINRAKGLEFDAVFLPELDWKAQVRPTACLTQRAAVTDAAPPPSPPSTDTPTKVCAASTPPCKPPTPHGTTRK